MREKRQIGQEIITFCDGEEKEVKVYSVPNFKMMALRRQFRKTKLTKDGKIDSVEFEDENYILAVLKQALGSQITLEDLQDVEQDLKEIHDKYFAKLSNEKKPSSTDTSEQNLDKKSEE